MLRVFGHFLPVPPLILAVAEAIILGTALCLVVGPGHFDSPEMNPTRVQFAVLLALAVTIAMLGVCL